MNQDAAKLRARILLSPSKTTIRVIGRLHFLVGSNSRPEMAHLCDLEPQDGIPWFCSCESHNENQHHRGRVCRHLEAALRYAEEAKL